LEPRRFGRYDLQRKKGEGLGEVMLLQKERERLLELLQSRTSTHGERIRARKALDEDLHESEGSPDDESSSSREQEREPAGAKSGRR
jgi:hypothetical protein